MNRALAIHMLTKRRDMSMVLKETEVSSGVFRKGGEGYGLIEAKIPIRRHTHRQRIQQDFEADLHFS